MIFDNFRFKEVQIYGPFRSGTNLMKLIIEDNYRCKAYFNKYWWKNMPAPTLFENRRGKVSSYKADFRKIIMLREPSALCYGFFKHWRKTRPALLKNLTFGEFIRAPFIVHDNSFGNLAPKYYYENPLAYINQYCISWLTWEDASKNIQYINLLALTENTAETLNKIAEAFNLKLVQNAALSIPMNEVLPSSDLEKSAISMPRIESERFELEDEDSEFIMFKLEPSVRKLLLPSR